MVRKFLPAVGLAAALTFIGTYAGAIDFRQHSDDQMRQVYESDLFLVESDRHAFVAEWAQRFGTYPADAAVSAIRPVSWGFSFSAGRHGGYRHYRQGYRHHGRHGDHYGYRVYRRHNFYGPSRNFYDSDGSYSYDEKRYYGDHAYRYGRGGQYRNGGGPYRHRSPHGREFGRRHH